MHRHTQGDSLGPSCLICYSLCYVIICNIACKMDVLMILLQYLQDLTAFETTVCVVVVNFETTAKLVC
jgi:hypothetical protein